MDIKHHPDASTLMTCAAGSQPEVLCAVVSSHLSLCKTCMDKVTRMEQIGVALLDALVPEPHGLDPTACRASALSTNGTTDPQKTPDAQVPAPLRAVIDTGFENLPWDAKEPGVASYSIEMSPEASGALRLVRIEPGSELPLDKYSGECLLLVIDGACEHQSAVLARGDYLEFHDGHTPRIRAASDKRCILLLAQEDFAH